MAHDTHGLVVTISLCIRVRIPSPFFPNITFFDLFWIGGSKIKREPIKTHDFRAHALIVQMRSNGGRCEWGDDGLFDDPQVTRGVDHETLLEHLTPKVTGRKRAMKIYNVTNMSLVQCFAKVNGFPMEMHPFSFSESVPILQKKKKIINMSTAFRSKTRHVNQRSNNFESCSDNKGDARGGHPTLYLHHTPMIS
ncbi:hypothetical protein TNCV_3511101 [Trichonephila clavipes]|nr:hypothetical protein TNCV_3511101 [Trichonephila clavipes]